MAKGTMMVAPVKSTSVKRRDLVCCCSSSPYLTTVLVTLLSLVGSSAALAEITEALPLELSPYRVHLTVAFDSPRMSGDGQAELLEDVRQAANRCVGSPWRLVVDDAAWLKPSSDAALARLKVSSLIEHAGPETGDFDVWQAAGIQSSGAGWRVCLRSWQPEVAVESEVVSAECFDRAELPLTLLRLSFAAFRPIGIVDSVEGKQARVLLKAGALSVSDESFSLANASKLYTPVLATRKRDRTIDRLQPIPWTFLSVAATERERLTCDIHSGLRSAIGGKKSGKVETLAIGVKVAFSDSQLELATQAKPSLPLVAHRIELRSTADMPKPDESHDHDPNLQKTLLTDRRGQVRIPATSNENVVWLFAYSGNHLLARVPVVPGVSPTLRLEVPDDSARLAAESDLYRLQGELIEAVAARNTAAASVRLAVKKNDAVRAKQAVADLKKLPDAQVYLDRVTAIRVPALKLAQSRKDRAGEARIKRMCDEMTELVKQYLSEDKRQAVLEELKELVTDDDPAEKPARERS